MAHIKLSGRRGKDKVTIVDSDVYERYCRLSWHLSDTGYALSRIRMDDGAYRRCRLHRLIMGAAEGEVVDHLNGDRLDNRRSNLRICTQAANSRNRHDTKGYSWDAAKKKFIVRYRGKFYGRYSTEEEARGAYALATSGVEYRGPGSHPRRKYVPRGVLYMKSRLGGVKFYIRPQLNGVKYFRGYFATAEEAQKEYQTLIKKIKEENRCQENPIKRGNAP